MKIAGKGYYVDEKGKKNLVKGNVNLSDSDVWQSLTVSGKVSFGNISCEQVEFKGTCKGTTLFAKNISVSGDFKVDSVKTESRFKVSGRIEIKNLDAKNIVIESRESSIGEIKCDSVKIFNNDNSEDDGIFSKILGGGNFKSKSNSRLKIKNIFAEKVELENCEVEEITCDDAFINSNCVIKKLTVKNTCDIAADSKVGEIIRS